MYLLCVPAQEEATLGQMVDMVFNADGPSVFDPSTCPSSSYPVDDGELLDDDGGEDGTKSSAEDEEDSAGHVTKASSVHTAEGTKRTAIQDRVVEGKSASQTAAVVIAVPDPRTDSVPGDAVKKRFLYRTISADAYAAAGGAVSAGAVAGGAAGGATPKGSRGLFRTISAVDSNPGAYITPATQGGLHRTTSGDVLATTSTSAAAAPNRRGLYRNISGGASPTGGRPVSGSATFRRAAPARTPSNPLFERLASMQWRVSQPGGQQSAERLRQQQAPQHHTHGASPRVRSGPLLGAAVTPPAASSSGVADAVVLLGNR